MLNLLGDVRTQLRADVHGFLFGHIQIVPLDVVRSCRLVNAVSMGELFCVVGDAQPRYKGRSMSCMSITIVGRPACLSRAQSSRGPNLGDCHSPVGISRWGRLHAELRWWRFGTLMTTGAAWRCQPPTPPPTPKKKPPPPHPPPQKKNPPPLKKQTHKNRPPRRTFCPCALGRGRIAADALVEV